jgi:hypothetical protein
MAFDFKNRRLSSNYCSKHLQRVATNMVRTGISKEQQIGVCTDDHPFAHRGSLPDKIKMKEIKDINIELESISLLFLPLSGQYKMERKYAQIVWRELSAI